MNGFIMNNYIWKVKHVPSNSSYLIDRTGEYRLATTDPRTRYLYLSDELYGDLYHRVLLHELSHAIMFSYNLINELHSFVLPEYWIDAEEWVCNLIADYGWKIFSIARDILGEEAIVMIPYELEKIIA